MPNPMQFDVLTTNRDQAPAFWALGDLWVILVDSTENNGAFSVMEQWMPVGAGPGPHVHPIDEWFYVFEGRLDMVLDGRKVVGKAGDSVWIPRGAVHAFSVSEAAHVLNGYTPGGFEQVIKGIGTPAKTRDLPPADLKPDRTMIDKLFDNYWSAKGDSAWAKLAPQR